MGTGLKVVEGMWRLRMSWMWSGIRGRRGSNRGGVEVRVGEFRGFRNWNVLVI